MFIPLGELAVTLACLLHLVLAARTVTVTRTVTTKGFHIVLKGHTKTSHLDASLGELDLEMML